MSKQDEDVSVPGVGTEKEFLKAAGNATREAFESFKDTEAFQRAYTRFIRTSDIPKSAANADAIGTFMADIWGAAFGRGALYAGKVYSTVIKALTEEEAAAKAS